MSRKQISIRITQGVMALILLVWGMAGSSEAITYYLRADVVTKTMPNGVTVPVWGFAMDSDANTEDGVVTVPGPILRVPSNDSTLTIHVKNRLTLDKTGTIMGCPICIVIPGQIKDMSPVRWPATPFPEYEGRIRSLDAEVMPGMNGSYTWNNVREGSFVYHSGTHMQCHVQMGLYGGVIKDFANGEAYDGYEYDNEVILFYSEIDSAFHQTVATGNYGPGQAVTSTIDYYPDYFMINGSPFTGDPNSPGAVPIVDHPIVIEETTLVRMFNCGLNTHSPTFNNMRVEVIAEDGYPYPYSMETSTVTLEAGKTKDALFTADTQGRFTVYDRSLALKNTNGTTGGMLTFLDVAVATGAPIATADNYSTPEDTLLVVNAPGVLSNDSGTGLATNLVQDAVNGNLTLNSDGSFTYDPDPNFSGFDTFRYFADDGSMNSNTVTVTITVNAINDPPVAVTDTYVVNAPVFTVPAPGVLANDTDADGDTLTVSVLSDVSNGVLMLNGNGGFTYTADQVLSGTDTFTYQVSDGNGGMDSAIVYLGVAAPDTDMDGKPDGCETQDLATLTAPGSQATNMLLPDSDGDGLLDGEEDPMGCPVTVATVALTNPRSVDTDGDGIWDSIEIYTTNTDPLDPNSPFAYNDADGDALPFSVDPNDNNPDTDGDGYLDTYEVAQGTDPSNPSDTPVLGDVNNDGLANNVDALILFNYVLGNTDIPYPGRADIVANGIVNNVDVLLLFNWTLANVAVIPVIP